MSGFPDDKFKNECLYAASYIAYEYCREYAYAVEEGLRLASIELKSQENVEKNCEDVNQEEVDIILQSVRSSTGNAIDFIQEHQLQIHAKDSLQNGVERTYKYKPDITMRSTSLNHRYHKVARKVIEYVFEEYQAIIETAKLEGLNIVYASSNRVIQKAIEILASTIHSRCRNFRLRLFELEKKVETLFTKMPFEQESVQNQHVKLEGTNELLLHQEASETIPEKRKQSGESATQAAKRPVRQVIQVFDCDDSSDDDFELMEVKKSINMAVSEPGSSSQSGNTKRTDNQQLLENTKSLADSSSKAQAAPQLTSLDSKKITQDTVGFKTEFQPSMQNTNFPNSVSSTGKEYGIDEILGKGVTLFLELTLNARSGLEAILDQFECAGLVQILKKGMSSDAEQLIVAMVNGEDISARRIKRMHNKGTQEGRISAMMLFLASFSERRDLRDVGRTQTTYRTFITLSKQDQNRSISTVKRRFRSHSKAAYEFLNAEETQNCEKLCIPIWTLNDAIEKSIVCKAPKSLQKMFSDDDHLVREVAHLIRCILVLICWTMQDEDLIKRMRRIFKLCKPFIGLNHVLPIDAVYISGVRSTEETAEGSTSGYKGNFTKDNATNKSFVRVLPPSEASEANYIERAKLLLGDGYECQLTFHSYTKRGTALRARVYLYVHMDLRLTMNSEWLQGKNFKVNDWVKIKLILGSQYHYSSDGTQKGAKLLICDRNLAGKEQGHQLLVSPDGLGARIIKQVILDRQKGKIGYFAAYHIPLSSPSYIEHSYQVKLGIYLRADTSGSRICFIKLKIVTFFS